MLKDANKPIELTYEENKVINYVRANDLSMCPTANLQNTAIACKYLAVNKIPGDFVECGVYRGGNSIIAAKIFEIHGVEKKIFLFDTFTGMTEPGQYDFTTLDSPHVVKKRSLHDMYLSKQQNGFTDWAYSSIEEVKSNFKKLNLLSDKIVFIKGKVEDTLSVIENIPTSISFLRLDTDWYESTKKELETLYDRVVVGGIIVIDDYGFFDGARKAVDEYFTNSLPPFFSMIDPSARIGVKIAER